MRKLLLLPLLLCSVLGWSAIAFVGNATPVAGTSNTTTSSISYTPTNGNKVVILIGHNGSTSSESCSDNNGLSLTQGPVNSQSVSYAAVYYYTVSGSPTSFTCSWTTSRTYVFVVLEYSGVSSVNASPTSNMANTSSTICTTSPVSTVANDFMVGGCTVGSSKAWTNTVGNQRVTNNSASGSLAAADSTSGGSSGSGVTITQTAGTSAVWTSAYIELKPPATVFSKGHGLSF